MQNGKASGDIYPMRFIRRSTTDGLIVQCGANERPDGISQKDMRRSSYIDSSGKAAATGEPIGYYQLGEIAALTLAGTVQNGYRLKSDADGKGVYADTDKDHAGGNAMSDGVSGEHIPVLVLPIDIAV